MDGDNVKASAPVGCLSQIGLLAVITAGTAVVLFLTVLFPPWLEVKAQRQQVLYWSQTVKEYDASFAGYHFLFADRRWQTNASSPNKLASSGQVYDVTGYRIFWGLLIAEWVVIVCAAAGLFFLLSSRLRNFPIQPIDPKATSAEKSASLKWSGSGDEPSSPET